MYINDSMKCNETMFVTIIQVSHYNIMCRLCCVVTKYIGYITTVQTIEH